MRAALALIVALGLAAPAAAQDSFQRQGLDAQMRENELRAEQQLANQRAIAQQNELTTLESRIQTEQAIRQLQAQAQSPRLPAPDPNAPPATLDTGQIASIPDKTLADFDQRVRDAAARRR
ncbi:MAG: hypothetical protein ABI655_13815 [Phenylobacterium sp.]